MADVSFDVLEALDGFKSAGFSEAQARAVADQLQQVVASRQGDLVTKADLKVEMAQLRTEMAQLRTEFRTELAQLRTEVRTEIGNVKTELLKAIADQQRWTIGAMVLLTSILFGAIKLL